MLSVAKAETLIHAFMTSRLDYCNVLLGVFFCMLNKQTPAGPKCSS